MSRPYTPYSTSRSGRHRASDEPVDYPDDFEPTERFDHPYYGGYDAEGYDPADYAPVPADNRWVWVAGAAGAILLVAVICTAVILGGGDSGSVSGTVAAPEPTQAAPTEPRTVIATPAPPAQSLPPERITTVTPTPSASARPTASAAPPPTETVAPTQAAPAPRTVTYQVTGNRPLLDLVTVIYTDQQGALRTDVNVALPWAKTIELNPGVELTSVTATSVTGQLNCSITDAEGATIVAQTNNSIIATCTR